MYLITTHSGADFDGFCSSVLLSLYFKPACVTLPGSMESKLRQFISKNKKHLPELHKISSIKNMDSSDGIVVADTSSIQRLSDIQSIVETVPPEKTFIFDHHIDSQQTLLADHEFIKKSGSTTSIVVSFLIENNIEIPPFYATLGLLGIYEDTDFLSFPETTPDDLIAASNLLKFGGDLTIVSETLKHPFTDSQVVLFNRIIPTIEKYTFKGRDVAVAQFITDQYESDISGIIHKIVEFENLNLFFCIFQMEKKVYLIVKNNYKDINLSELFSDYVNGGGHENIFTAIFKKKTIFEVRRQVDEIISNLPSSLKAKDICRPPVHLISSDSLVTEASKTINVMRVNSLPVVDSNKTIQGVITRKDIDYAMLHNFSSMKVSEIMSMDMVSVEPETDIEIIRDIFLESNIKMVFVMEQTVLSGIITRTEAFKKVLFQVSNTVKIRNYKDRMRTILPENYYSILKKASEVADRQNIELYIVGGFVRDLLLRKPNYDLDLVAGNNGIEFAGVLSKELNGRCVPHYKFNTAVIILPDKTRIDVATSRFEYYKTPGSLPVITNAHLYHDLYRRDFSINAMAIKLNPSLFGELVDYFNGKRDLKDKTIRTLHSLSFIDDPTRMIRALRFKHRLKFKIGKTTEGLLKSAIQSAISKNLSQFRFFKEIQLLFSEENVSSTFDDLSKYSIFSVISKNIRILPYQKALACNADSVISWHKLLYKKDNVEYWMIYFFIILMSVKGGDKGNLLKRFNFIKKYNRIFSKVSQSLRNLEIFFSKLKKDTVNNSELYFFLKEFELEILLFSLAYFDNELIKKSISYYITYLKDFMLYVNGNDIKGMGISQGPEIKRLLEQILSESMDNSIIDRDKQLLLMKRIIKK